MRVRSLIVLLLLATGVAAEDRWIPISGSVGVFRSDARVFNPSFEKDIQITARFLPGVNPPASNAAIMSGAGQTFTVPKRSMLVLNDVVTTLFSSTGVGALAFTSEDPFEVTSRIYAQQGDLTFGQFAPGFSPGLARTKGAVLQMKASGASGQVGTFRTNVGVVNTANAETTVQWRLYDKNNALAGTGTTVLPAFAVTPPIAMADPFFWGTTMAAGTDLSDGWISFTATNPIFVYASLLDNGTQDQTFIPSVDDVGVPPSNPPPGQTTHTFDVTLEDFSITFSPSPASRNIRVGDQVVLRIRRLENSHGFQLVGPGNTNLVPDTRPGSNAVERSFTVAAAGIHTYFCTVITCGAGHNSMVGSFSVGVEPGDGPGPGY
jgi:hypothetical protein